MEKAKENQRLESWIDVLQSQGRNSFSTEQLEKDLPDNTAIGIKRALSRLSQKGKIISIFKGYYLIIPPQYSSRGVLPLSIFLDEFMKFLDRPYYLGLLNAI